MHIKPGNLIVFEGLDATGKSLQAGMLAEACDPRPHHLHMPSGETELTQSIYKATEEADSMNDITRQLLHLAAHAEHQTAIRRYLIQESVILDRWWWSTFAYGWFNNDIVPGSWDMGEWLELCLKTWQNLYANVVLYFSEPYTEDRHNSKRLLEGYNHLIDKHVGLGLRYVDRIILVPTGTYSGVHDFIVEALVEHGSLAR